MGTINATLARLAVEAQSPNQQTRGQAVQDLLMWCQRDASIGVGALPIFHGVVANWRDAWSCRCGVRGIELIEGVAVARDIRLKLLSDPREQVVMGAALEISDPSFTPALIETLARWREPRVRQTIIATLGRLHHPEALPILAAELADAQRRPHVVEALKEFGDPRAIAFLEPYRNDPSPAWPVDNHGPMLFVRDLVAEAIARLSNTQPRMPNLGDDLPKSARSGESGSMSILGIVCIAVGALSILANLYALSLAQGAYELSRTPSIAPSVSGALDPALASRIAKAAN